MSGIVIGVIALFVGAVAWKILSGGLGDAVFVVKIDGEGSNGISLEGKVPGHSESDVRDFIAGLELPKGSKVWGVPDRERYRLSFSGDVPEELHQRMRNFFYSRL